MTHRSAQFLPACAFAAASALFITAAILSNPAIRTAAAAASNPVKIAIDYPLSSSVFPPEITPPTFLWHDPSESVKKLGGRHFVCKAWQPDPHHPIPSARRFSIAMYH
jgi:hypothetical protein